MRFRANSAFHSAVNGFSLATLVAALLDVCSLNKGTLIASRPYLTPFSSVRYNSDCVLFCHSCLYYITLRGVHFARRLVRKASNVCSLSTSN